VSVLVDLALIHYPVLNKNKEIIGAAVTNLDIHDIARAGRTYGVGAFYIVTPYEDQLQELYEQVTVEGQRPAILATSAQSSDAIILSYPQVKEKINQGNRILILFGTAWGLTDEVMEEVDAMLPPISGGGSYNHLSVRSAVSIVLDRLLGNDRG
jgi:tRNA (guanine37-N1)-methyltransferase